MGSALPALLLGFLAACSSEPEGSYAGECLDNIDNDRDGLVDCEDEDCTNSFDCEEGGDTWFPPPYDSERDSGWDPHDTYFFNETEINAVQYGYTTSEWDYSVDLLGWGSDVLLDWYQYEGGYVWEEWHYFDNTDAAPDGSWDEWDVTIPIVSDYSQQQNDVNTLFQGTLDRESALTWMITTWDMSGAHADCVVWGKRQEYYGGYGCLSISF